MCKRKPPKRLNCSSAHKERPGVCRAFNFKVSVADHLADRACSARPADRACSVHPACWHRRVCNVRFGSKAEVKTLYFNVPFTPERGHVQRKQRCPLWAISGHHRSDWNSDHFAELGILMPK